MTKPFFPLLCAAAFSLAPLTSSAGIPAYGGMNPYGPGGFGWGDYRSCMYYFKNDRWCRSGGRPLRAPERPRGGVKRGRSR